jgi:polyphenol oxidase
LNDQAREAGGFTPVILRSPVLARLDWLEHGFGTRLAPDWPPAPAYANLRQIHSDIVINAGAGACGMLGEGDGLVSREPGLWLGVRTADCAPVILADSRHRAVAVIHAGWRGAVGQILARALDRMQSDFGSRPSDLIAAVGPAIGPCCFEVGEDVAGQFAPWWPERTDLNRKTKINLGATLARQLATAGLTPENIAVLGECTHCSPERYHSFRRDGQAAGRMVSAVRILA